jgi:hypothetical protein
MERENTESLVRNLALMEVKALTADIDDLAMKIEVLKEGFASVSQGLKDYLKQPEPAAAPLMLPAPKKGKAHGRLCPVCKKFLKKGEEVHESCKETTL